MSNPTTVRKHTNQKVTGSHFTPTGLAHLVARRLLKELDKNPLSQMAVNVLDPACGDGELLVAMSNESTNKRLNLMGIDQNNIAIADATKRFRHMRDTTQFVCGDFLEMVHTEESAIKPADVIIANPPYVRTQILGAEKAQKLAEKFHVSGRVDLYHAFLVAMTHQVKPGGLLGVITSNRYLTTQGGGAIREFLFRNYDIIEILDLGDTKLFEAAVLPAVFIGRKKTQWQDPVEKKPARFLKIYEEANDSLCGHSQTVASVYDLLDSEVVGTYFAEKAAKHYTVSVGDLVIPQSHKEPWVMATNHENDWRGKIDDGAAYLIEDIAEVKVGIKTTADKVFIRSDWEQLAEPSRPEAELLRPLLSTDYADRWIPLEKVPTKRVLYTHEVREGKRRAIDLTHYTKAAGYLEQHRERLESRKYVMEAKRNWYEMWVPHDPESWKLPKIAFPDISPEPKFFYDTEGCIIDGNCYWIIQKNGFENDMLFLIMAIANTRLMTKYHDIAFQNKLYAGRRRYLTQYVKKYPVPDPTTDVARRIITLAKQLVFESVGPDQKKLMEEEIETCTALAFGVAPL